MGCLSCFKSSKEPKKSWKCWKGKLSKEETSRKRKRKGSKDEESSKEKGSKGCFICKRSSKDTEPSRKKGKCGICCFGGNKSSSEEPLRQKGKRYKLLKCCVCAKSSERKGFFSCFKSSKKKESRKRGEKAMAKSSEGKASKQRCLRGPGCLKGPSCWCGCSCCFSSAYKNLNKGKGKKVLCWKKKEKKKTTHLESLVKTMSLESDSTKHRSAAEEILRIGKGNIAARVFTYSEIAAATRDFAPECLLGKGGFGKVYKGLLMETKQTVAVKRLDRSGYQGNREFLVEVLMLSLLSHPNLVNLLGYCADGDERILVYDYMPLGSLEDHLFDLSPDSKPWDWNTRMKIALGAARGLEHLHVTTNPPVIFRDFKSSNILLDHDFNPRLADFGLAKIGPVGAKNHVSTRVMGTFGYCAPEYVMTGKLTTMSDIYSFGVVLLELITGRKAMDPTRPRNEQRLVDWATPLLKDKKNFLQMADPLLEGNFPVKSLYQALAIAAMCIHVRDSIRPIIIDVVSALHFLTMPNSNRPSEEVPENSIPENELPPQQQIETNDCVATNDEDSPHSSEGDWQSCSTEREGELKHEADIT